MSNSVNFEMSHKGDLLLFNLASDLTAPVAIELAVEAEAMAASHEGLRRVVLDMKEKFLADLGSLRPLGSMALALRKRGCAVFVLAPARPLRAFLAENGMESLLRPISALEEAGARSASSVNVDFVNPFIDGAIETLRVQCSLECRPRPVMLKAQAGPTNCDIAGVIGLTSRGFNGSIAICFPEKVFLGAMSRMLGEEFSQITPDLEDGAGELLNMIFGHAKKVLNERGYTLEKAIPTVVRGKGIEVKHLTATRTLLQPFETELGNFFIEIGTENLNQGG